MKLAGVPAADLPPEPEVDPRWRWIWRAWHRLHNGNRTWAAGGLGPAVPGSIPWTVVRLWARHHDMTKGEMAMLDHCLQAMDQEFAAWWASRQPAPDGRRRRGAR